MHIGSIYSDNYLLKHFFQLHLPVYSLPVTAPEASELLSHRIDLVALEPEQAHLGTRSGIHQTI